MVNTLTPSFSKSSSAGTTSEQDLFGSNWPLGYAGGDTSLYRYVGNNPTNATDPSGLISPADPPFHEPWPKCADKALAEIKKPENSERLRKVMSVALSTKVVPTWFHRCHAWVGEARDRIVALGKEYYDNDEYVITYVDWDITDSLGHGGLRIHLKKTDNVYYLDIGTLGGVFNEVPPEYGKESGMKSLVPRQSVPFWPWET